MSSNNSNPETLLKKCGKYLFEQKRLSIIKDKDEISSTTIIKKEINKSSEDKNEFYSTMQQLRENLNIKETEESIFICHTIIDSNLNDLSEEDKAHLNLKNFTEINKSAFAEAILNQHIKKNVIKIEDTKKSNKNMIYENPNMIIIKALIYLNKDDTIYSLENFQRKKPDLYKSKNEEDNKFEKNVYIRIEDRLREYLNKIKLDKLSQLRNIETIYIQKILDFPKKSENYKYICIKGIIIGLLNIINDLIGKEYLKISEESKNNDIEKGDFILDIFKKFDIIKQISKLIEKDFAIFIQNFKQENNLQFNFIDLITDIFWDYVLRIKEISQFFTNNYGSENINMKLNEFFDKMVDILIKIDQPYKKIIGELLGISCIKKEKFYLMEYVVKYKNASKEKENMKEKDMEKSESKIIKLNMSPSCDNILNNKHEINNIEIKEKKKENEMKKEDKEIIKDLTNFELDDKNLNFNLDLGKSLSMDLCKNKLSDKDSLDKVYNYILYGENENDNEKKKTKKRHKKRKKNKNNNLINISYDNDGVNDPVVDEFKNFLNDLNSKRSKDYVKKISPKISEDWLKNIDT